MFYDKIDSDENFYYRYIDCRVPDTEASLHNVIFLLNGVIYKAERDQGDLSKRDYVKLVYLFHYCKNAQTFVEGKWEIVDKVYNLYTKYEESLTPLAEMFEKVGVEKMWEGL